MRFVYLIQHTATKQIYIGRTDNPRKRLKEHNNNEQAATKRKVGKWILVYVEAYRDEADANIRERRLKQHGRAKQELKKRLAKSLLD